MFDVDAFWQCECGYLNAGSDRCIMCNARGPLDDGSAVAVAPGLAAADPDANGNGANGHDGDNGHGGDEPAPAAWSAQEWRALQYAAPPIAREAAGRKATKTVFVIIFLNFIAGIATFVAVYLAGMEGVDAAKFLLLENVVFFGMVALFVLARSAEMGIRPRWVRGGKLLAAGEGILVGGSIAVALMLLVRELVGRPVVDEYLVGLAAEGSISLVLFGILVVVLIGPVVEELVFRGFFAEVFRRRGIWLAMLFSAAAFSLAHLRPALFIYFFVMGIVFGLVYWHRGLIGSIGAHAAFNGLLLVFAIAVVTGPAVLVQEGGVGLTLPGRWQQSEAPGTVISAVGPLSARFEVTQMEMPLAYSASDLAGAFASSSMVTPLGIEIDPASIGLIELPAGQAVSLTADVYGQTGKVVMLPKGNVLWAVSMQTMGSDRAEKDFHEIIWSWRIA